MAGFPFVYNTQRDLPIKKQEIKREEEGGRGKEKRAERETEPRKGADRKTYI